MKVVNKVFEGAKVEVLLPWGASAAETPVHILEAMRALMQLVSRVEPPTIVTILKHKRDHGSASRS